MAETHGDKQPHIALLPSPGIGHLSPMVEFPKRLLPHQPSLNFTFLIVSGQFPASVIADLSEHPNVRCVSLPPVDTSALPPDTRTATIISVVMHRSLEPMQKILLEISPISALVFDFFCTDALDVAEELQLPAYILFPSTATLLSLLLYLPVLDEEIPGEYRDLKEPVRAPGCLPFRGPELANPLLDRQDVTYRWILHHSRRFKEATGIILNSVDELEQGAIRALLEGREYRCSLPPVYPIGPLVKTADEIKVVDESQRGCLKWLDQQPPGSVLFICFGSGGTLTEEQLVELAHGLEKSKQRFLMVARQPHSCASAAFFESGGNEDTADYLPPGFVQRTAEVGLVVPGWAPQVKILAHKAVGGFLSHCGWNSTLESIMGGVPMIGWPLYAEQRMNARMLVEEIGVAVAVKNEGRVVPREEVEEVVRLLMEGEDGKKLRKRVKEVRASVEEAMEEKGSTYRRLDQLVREWEKCDK